MSWTSSSQRARSSNQGSAVQGRKGSRREGWREHGGMEGAERKRNVEGWGARRVGGSEGGCEGAER